MGFFLQILAEPAAQQAGRLTAQELAGLPLGWDVQNSLFGDLLNQRGPGPGQMAPWQTGGMGGAANEGGGETSLGATTNWASLGDRTFDWTPGDDNSGVLTAYNADGSQAGQWTQAPEQSLLGGLLEWGALAAAGFGGAGLAGLGPLSGVLGGAFGSAADMGAGASVGGAGLDGGAGVLAADGAGVVGPGVSTTGGASYGTIGLAPGVAGATPGTFAPVLGQGGASLASGAGLTAPMFAGGGEGVVGGLGMTAGAGAASGGSSLFSSLSDYLPAVKSLASLASGVYGLKLAGDVREASDPFAPYRAAYGQKLAALEANPGSITTRPGFQAGLETIGRKSAASGYYGSGNMASALARYSGDVYNQEATRLASLAGAGQTPGAGQATAADLASQSLGSIGYGLGPLLQRLTQGG